MQVGPGEARANLSSSSLNYPSREGSGDVQGEAVRRVRETDVGERHRHWRVARRLEGRGDRQAEVGLAVLDREVARRADGRLVDGLGVVPAAVDAQRGGGQDDVDLCLVAEAGLLTGDRKGAPTHRDDGGRVDEVRAP